MVIYYLLSSSRLFSQSRSSETPKLSSSLPRRSPYLSDLVNRMATPMVEDTTSFEEDQLASMSTEDITRATRLLDNEIRILKVCPITLSISFWLVSLLRNYPIVSLDMIWAPRLLKNSSKLRLKSDFDLSRLRV